jgi:predicted enzyme related to lactoylglutathione lyase
MIEKGRVMPTARGPRVIVMTVMGPDVEVLRSFYEPVFGIEFEGEDHGDGLQYHATGGSFSFPDGLFLFTLWAYHDDWPRLRCGIEMFVSGVDAVYERAVENGATSVLHLSTAQRFRAAPFRRPCREPGADLRE